MLRSLLSQSIVNGHGHHIAKFGAPAVRALGAPMTVGRAPRYTIDLDLPPERRWEQPVEEMKHTFPHAIDYLRRSLGYSRVLERMATSASAYLVRHGRIAHSRELLAIAHQTNIPVGRLAALQFAYEATAQCTAMIVPNANDGSPLHARTMDWPAPFLQQMTIDADFQRNGATVFRAAMFVGMTGILTGVRPHQYSVAINHRRVGNGRSANLGAIISSNGGAWTVPSLLRHVLENGPVHATNGTSSLAMTPQTITREYQTECYTRVVDVLSSAPLIAPCYLTVAGSLRDQGCLITRNRTGEEKRWNMNDDTPLPGTYIIQSNNDHWMDSAMSDIPTTNTFDAAKSKGATTTTATTTGTMLDHNATLLQCARRALVTKHIYNNASNTGTSGAVENGVAGGWTVEQLEQLLNEAPILSELTIHGAIMSPAHDGLLRTII